MYNSFCYVAVEQNCIYKYIMLYISLQSGLHLWDNCLSVSTLSSLYSLFHCSGPSRPSGPGTNRPQVCAPLTVLLFYPLHPAVWPLLLLPLHAPGSRPAFGVHAVWVPCMEKDFPQAAPGPSLRGSCGLRSTKEGCGQWAWWGWVGLGDLRGLSLP